MIPKFVKEREEQGLGFDLYFAGTQCDECEVWMLQNSVCRLQSQLNDRKNIRRWIEENTTGKLFIDSGAYTALTQGKEVDVDEYIQYINSISSSVTAFAQLDYIPKEDGRKEDAARKSWENYLYMVDKVAEPSKLVPIFHQSEDWYWLKNMVEYKNKDGEYISYIGFGALTGATTDVRRAFFRKCFSVIAQSKNPNVKVHAMGMTSLTLLESYPFYSADSTGWIMQGAMGNILTPWGLIDVSDKNKFDKNSFLNLNSSAQNGILQWLEKYGMTLEDIKGDYKKRMLCNLITLTEWSKKYKYKGGEIRFRSLF